MSNNLKLINTNTINSKPIHNYIKVKNTGGPKGDTGATGATGPQGPQGPAGQAATINIGETTTLLPGQTATVTNTGTQQNATLNFGIPQGLRGPTGAQGPKGDTGPQGLKGDKGNDGAAASVTVGITNTGEPGSNASVTNLGTSSNAILSFTIPTGSRGPQGQTGPQGPKGEYGEKGDKGDAGQAATVTVGSTTTTNPGTSATVTNSGTTSAAVLNFGIPRGATGSVKSEVVSELPETGEGDTFYLVNREATTQTATGKTISFTNSENTGDITDAQIDGETSQNGTPTPDAPVPVKTVTGENVVKICGKNLFDASNADIGHVWNGTANAKRAYGYIEAIQGQTYTVSASNTNSDLALSVVETTTVGTVSAAVKQTTLTTSLTFIPQSATKYIVVLFSTTTNNITQTDVDNAKVQIELGSATAYEAYKSQSYEVNLGKNMFDKDNANVLNAYFALPNDTTITSNAQNRTLYVPCDANTTYTFQAMGSNWIRQVGYTSTTPAVGVSVSGIANLTYNATNVTITTDSTAKYLVFRFWHQNNSTETYQQALDSIQIELGSQATSYAAYFEPIELCKIGDYQDYIYKDGSDWKIHKATGKYTVTGSESFGIYNGMITVPNTEALQGQNDTLLSSHFVYKWANQAGACYVSSVNRTINFGVSGISTEAAAAEWAAGNMPMFYYILATPTDTEITNSALIEQLDNLASAALYSGTNNISTVTANEVPTLELDYVTYDKYNQNKVYIYNEATGVWQIIVQ